MCPSNPYYNPSTDCLALTSTPLGRVPSMAVHGSSLFLLLLLLLMLMPCFTTVVGGSVGSDGESLCSLLVLPLGFPCIEHTVETKDGYLLGVQQIPSNPGKMGYHSGPPIFLQHGLFQGGDIWFANAVDQSLGFILADQGFDVWVGNVRGTRWSHGHTSLSEIDKEFWDWSWQDLAEFDLADMIGYVYGLTNSKIFYVGHSQGTIMALAALTRPEVAYMVEAAALLCPISYLGHVSSLFVLKAVDIHLDEMLQVMGIYQLDFRSDMGVQILKSVCDGHMDCSDLLAAITGNNCCFNNSRMDYYLQYEPHPSSLKNLMHLFQMIRKGTFAKYDYGILGNLKLYGTLWPPAYDVSTIPRSIPLWLGYGGIDDLADVKDVEAMVKELQSKPGLLYLESYGHIDFILSVTARHDVYNQMIDFFRLFLSNVQSPAPVRG